MAQQSEKFTWKQCSDGKEWEEEHSWQKAKDRAEKEKKSHNLNFSRSRVVTDLDIMEYLTGKSKL